jgi:hypothetical protein
MKHVHYHHYRRHIVAAEPLLTNQAEILVNNVLLGVAPHKILMNSFLQGKRNQELN